MRRKFIIGNRAILLLAAALATALGVSALGQDEPVPKPKPKPSAPASKPATKSTPSSGATLLVMCDLACSWKLDGEAKGTIPADGSAKVRIELGQHSISTAAMDGPDQLSQDVEIKQTGQTMVHMNLSPVRAARLQKVEEEARTAKQVELAAAAEKVRSQQEEDRVKWRDTSTGLEWTKTNKKDVDLQAAKDYCQSLKLTNQSDWRLPSIDELQAIYDPKVSVPVFDGTIYSHIKGELEIYGFVWSDSRGNSLGETWTYNFFDGGRSSRRNDHTFFNSALCVRRYEN